jgi:hypothetical protein
MNNRLGYEWRLTCRCMVHAMKTMVKCCVQVCGFAVDPDVSIKCLCTCTVIIIIVL